MAPLIDQEITHGVSSRIIGFRNDEPQAAVDHHAAVKPRLALVHRSGILSPEFDFPASGVGVAGVGQRIAQIPDGIVMRVNHRGELNVVRGHLRFP